MLKTMNESEPMISAIMPCLNEIETLAICIEKAKRGLERTGFPGEVVIADNGSTDGSIELAESLGARVVHQPIRGYGAALQAGARNARGKYIVMADADDSYDWESIPDFVTPLLDGADLVMGNRFKGGIAKGAMPALHKYLGNPVLTFIARMVYRIPVGDFHCGMRGFTKDAFKVMKLQTTGMEFATEMIVRASRARLDIREVPTKLAPDGRTRPPHLRSFRDGWRHLRFILTYAPNYLYLVPGIALFVVGALLLTMLARGPVVLGGFFFGPHFVALGSLLGFLGATVLSLGVLARVTVWMDYPIINDPAVAWLREKFSLEVPLVVGTLLTLGGAGVWGLLLWRFLYVAGGMEDSIHLAFVATTAIAVGTVLIFSSFLLHLLLQHIRNLHAERESRYPVPLHR